MSEQDNALTDADKIRSLNDQFRTTLKGGRVMLTRGIVGRSDVDVILRAVKTFDNFSEDNDPYHERDFGALTHDGQQVFFKIDYYDLDLNQGSPDPTDSAITTRVLTIMLASEY